MQHHQYTLDHPTVVEFTQDDHRFSVEIIQMDVAEHVILKGHISVPVITKVLELEAFHFGDEEYATNWDADAVLHISMRLSSYIRSLFNSPDDIFRNLFQKNSKLTEASSWFAMEVLHTEKLPWGGKDSFTSYGIRTQWADI